MKLQQVKIGEMDISIPAYYGEMKAQPDDPENAKVFAVCSEHTMCFIRIYTIEEGAAMPLNQDAVIQGIHDCLAENQGLIQVECGKNYIYSIVKTHRGEMGGVQYTLTLDMKSDGCILHVQGFFDEDGMTGIRDTMVLELCHREGLVGKEDDFFYGWMSDPYDANYKRGLLMNLSEREEYDEMFPDFPLSLCSELARTLVAGKKKGA